MKKIWLVTGCSTGFGRELVKELAKRGEQVVGTVRKADQVSDLESINSEFVTGVVLDVQDQTSIDSTGALIERKFGRLDVLINNAGYGSLGVIEEISDKEMQRQFDVNVFGSVRMIKLALPFMRKQRSGHILNITSIAGLSGFTGAGIYNGSKFALEGIGEALASEVRHLGIKVTNIEPGPFRTEWAGRSATFSKPAIEDYAESGHKVAGVISEVDGKQVGDPVRAAKAMIDVVGLAEPPVHLPLGENAYKMANKKLAGVLDEIKQFEHLGRPTDYTEDELKELDG